MANMKLFSEVTGMEYEVKTYPMENGLRGICHESLQDILENQLTGISYNTEVLAATEFYCAAKCSIADITDNGTRKIQAFNDVNTKALEGREPEQEKFARAHPLLAATQSAIDTAVRTYLKWARCYPDETRETTVVDEVPENIPEDVLIETEDVVTEEITESAETEAPFDASEISQEDTPDDNVIPDTEETVDGSSTDDVETPSEETLSTAETDPDARLTELGKTLAPSSSKYSNMTLDEIWEKYPGWFNYVKNNSKSPAYVDVREYVQLKEAKEQH